MACCDIITQNFVNSTSTTVPVTSLYPSVNVLYYDEINDRWQIGGIFTQITITPGVSVTVDHGGAHTGVIRIQQ